MLNNGDKLIVTKKVASFLDVGDIVKVVDVNDDGMISFSFGEEFMHMGVMTSAECESHFEKVVEKKTAPTVTAERIDYIIDNSDIKAYTVFDKCTVVTCQLPNGFVIVESSACVSPDNYNEAIGINICMEKIADKVWELEGYRLQEELYRESMESKCDECAYDCNRCNYENSPCTADCIFPVNENIEYDEDDEEDDCLDTDLDCDDCDDFDCPFNSNPNR